MPIHFDQGISTFGNKKYFEFKNFMGRNDIPLSPNIKIWVNKISCITYKYIERGFCLQGSNPILGFISPANLSY